MSNETHRTLKKGSLIKFLGFWAILAGAASLVAFQGLASRKAQLEDLTRRTEAQIVRTVSIIQPLPPADWR